MQQSLIADIRDSIMYVFSIFISIALQLSLSIVYEPLITITRIVRDDYNFPCRICRNYGN